MISIPPPQDPVLGADPLSGSFSLPAERLTEFREKGHTVVRGIASSDEVAAHRSAIVEAGQRRRSDHRPLAERDTYGRAFLQLMNLWTVDARVRSFVFGRRFARAAAELLGVDGVRLYHDQALFKEPGGGHTPWHQDQFYWPLDTPHTVTLWMPLVRVCEDMGSVVFASGSQRLGSLGDFAIGDTSEERFDRLVRDYGFALESHAPLEPGDATFHSGWTLHRAGANATNRMREAITVIYFGDGARVGALDHPHRRADRDAWLAGCEPGEVAAGALNPVLYSTDV